MKKDRKSLKKFDATTDKQLAQVEEEKRLLSGKTLYAMDKDNTLFLHDTTGSDHILNKLGHKRKELTIEQIIRPRASEHVLSRPAAVKKGHVKERLPKIVKHSMGDQMKETTTVDPWDNSQDDGSKARRTVKRGAMRPPEYLSYRPEISTHVDNLLKIEVDLESRERRVMVPKVVDSVSIDNTTMEDRANEELLAGIPVVCDDPCDVLVVKPSSNQDTKKESKPKTRKDRLVNKRISQERYEAGKRRKERVLLKQLNGLHVIEAQFKKEQSLLPVLTESLTSDHKAQQQEEKMLSVPLLPDEVPVSLLKLPSHHANPLREQYARFTVERRARLRKARV